MKDECSDLWAEYVKLFGDSAGIAMTQSFIFARDRGSHGYVRGWLRPSPYKDGSLSLDTTEPLDVDTQDAPHG
jgi:hypothetical protein